MTHDEYVRSMRQRIRQTAQAMLAREMSFIEGARRIGFLWQDAELTASDPDIQPFLAIDRETETLPVGADRQGVAPEMPTRLKQDIDYAEDWARENAYLACWRLVERFEA